MTPSEVKIYEWSALPGDQPMPRLDRKRIMGAHAMLTQLTMHEGFVVAPHRHVNEQFACVLSGRVRFTLEEPDGSFREETLTSGQVLYVPGNVAHGAEALETSILIDVFSPPSEKTGVDG